MAIICWNIQHQRNDIVFKNKESNMGLILDNACGLIQEMEIINTPAGIEDMN